MHVDRTKVENVGIVGSHGRKPVIRGLMSSQGWIGRKGLKVAPGSGATPQVGRPHHPVRTVRMRYLGISGSEGIDHIAI
jgi:hypothetical protein